MPNLSFKSSPFQESPETYYAEPGQSLRQIIAGLGVPEWATVFVWVDDAFIKPSGFDLVPDEGQVISIKVIPRKDDDGKNPFAVLISIAVVVATSNWSEAVKGGSRLLKMRQTASLVAGSLAIGFAGSLLQRALIKPPTAELPPTGSYDNQDPSVYTLTGTRNSVNLYGPVPMLYGKHRVYPLIANRPYTFLKGNDQYLNMLFAVCMEDQVGDVILSDYKLGDTALTEFGSVELMDSCNYTDMTTAQKSYWSASIGETSVRVLVEQADGWVSRTTALDSTGFMIDLEFPQLVTFNTSNGSKSVRSVDISAQYKKTTDTDWIDLTSQVQFGTPVPPPTTYRRWGLQSGLVSDTIWMIGGSDGYGAATGISSFNTTTKVFLGANTWGTIADPRYLAASYHLHTATFDRLYVFGGYDNVGVAKFSGYFHALPFSYGLSQSPTYTASPPVNLTGTTPVYYADSQGTYFLFYCGSYTYVYNIGTDDWTTVANLRNDGKTGTHLYYGITDYISSGQLYSFESGDFFLVVGGLKAGETEYSQSLTRIYVERVGSDFRIKTAQYSENGPKIAYTTVLKQGTADQDFLVIGGRSTPTTTSSLNYKINRYAIAAPESQDSDLDRELGTAHISGSNIYYCCGYSVSLSQHFDSVTYTGTGFRRISNATSSPVRLTFDKWGLPEGQYDVRVKRVTADNTSDYIRDEMYWTVLRSVGTGDVITLPKVKTIAIRIKASEQLNGTIDNLSVLVQRKLYVENSGSYVKQITRNPAWAYLDVLRGCGTKSQVADAKIDFTAIETWADNCDTAERYCDLVIDRQTTMLQALQTIAATGRASFAIRDGLYTVIEDVPQTTYVQFFGPRNIIKDSFSATRLYKEVPHCIRAQFLNAEKDYQQDTRLVYADGYTSANATRFEEMQFTGITGSDQIYRITRYHLAVGILRPETYFIKADPEALVCTRGSLVMLMHPAVMVGLGTGRIKSFTDNGTTVTSITLDCKMSASTGVTYGCFIRHMDGDYSSLSVSVATTDYHDTFTVVGTGPAIADIESGQLTMIGTGQPCLVQEIEYDYELNSILTLVPYNASVYTADTEAIPAFDSNITLTPTIVAGKPDTPVIASLESDEDYLFRAPDGSLQSCIACTLSAYNSASTRPDFVSGLIRRTDSPDAPWEPESAQPADNPYFLFKNVEDGVEYDLKLRYETKFGMASDWSAVSYHTVIGKTSPPPDVTGLGYRIDRPGLVLYWDKVVVPDLWRYEVREGSDFDTGTTVEGGVLDVLSLNLGLIALGTYGFHLKSQDTSGNYSETETSVSVTVSGPSTPNVNGNQVNGTVTLAWQDCQTSYFIKTYRIYKGDTFAGASQIQTNNGNYAIIREDVGGTYTYWVQAVDDAGNLSTPGSKTLIVSDPTDVEVMETWGPTDFWDYDSQTGIHFEDTVTDVKVFGIPNMSTKTFEEVFTDKGWTSMADAIAAGYSYFGEPVDVGTATYLKAYDLGYVLAKARISVSTVQTQLDGDLSIQPTISTSTDGSTWTTYTNTFATSADNVRYVRIGFSFVSDSDDDLTKIYNYSVVVSAERQMEFGVISLIAGDPTGTILNFAKTYVEVQSVTVTPQSGSAYFCTVDSITTTTCRILAFDQAGNRVSTGASYLVMGV